MVRLWDIGIATMTASALITAMLLIMLGMSPDPSTLVFQTFRNEDRCVQQSMLCDASTDYSYLMETNPVAAALWTPCHVKSSRWGNTADVAAIDGGAREAFTVSACVSAGEIAMMVVHHGQLACTVPGAGTMEAMGLSLSDLVNDYIEVLLDGPERRLQRMEFASIITPHNANDTGSNACQYRLRLPVHISGTYRLQVVVIHSNIELKGIEPFRNYVLWDRLHNLSSQTPNEITIDTKNDSLETWHSAGGWMRTTGESRLGLHSAQALVAQQWNGESYRCPPNGTASFTWMPLKGRRSNVPAPRNDNKLLRHEEAMACARALAPQRKGTYPKLVLFGDSLMRQTFNAVAVAIGMENVTAIKEFKSLMESQDWGGSSIGLDLSFQWAARHNEGRTRCKQAFIGV